ncbi:hypothetical protein [Methylocapsa sp. S129]|uniref:hypothetical protein n=1 Tax=Methylocapsa sp. S129 TaxID=1641869 RepID=UPI00131B7E38|nr:hypothetical protein [Methylocapsa sp. S129]
MRAIALFLLLGLAGSPIGAAAAPAAVELNLTGDHYWAVLASRQDADQAIAAAQNNRASKAMVVRAANGWFAAVSGPYLVKPNTGRQFLDSLIKEHNAPKDVYLTKGSGFTDVTWTAPATNILAGVQYDGVRDVSLHKDDLDIKLTKRPGDDNMSVAVAIGVYKGKPAFKMEIADKPASAVSLVRLDPKSPLPQVVFTYFWQGAHCCTVTKIASLNSDGVWNVVDGGALDGDGGYAFEDLDNAGFSYLLSIDQSFLYTFDSYAGSAAPMRIQQLANGALVDVTKDSKHQRRLLQGLNSEEIYATEEDSWQSNGFLAGWVASSMLVGRGDAAWAKMLASYDHASDFGPEKCTIKVAIDKCPDDKKLKLAFPFALKQFLSEQGYVGDGSHLQVPYEVEPTAK